MNTESVVVQGYFVHIAALADGEYSVRYTSRGLQHERGVGGRPKIVPQFEARVRAGGPDSVTWTRKPADTALEQARFDDDARRRVRILHPWLKLLDGLIDMVKRWADELGWSTKVIPKPMSDSEVGDYRAPALLLQEGVTRILLEPIARSAPGAQGVADLYLMPAYDDIATLYYYDGKWHVHYAKPTGLAVASTREGESRPLTKASLRDVLAEMTSHAG